MSNSQDEHWHEWRPWEEEEAAPLLVQSPDDQHRFLEPEGMVQAEGVTIEGQTPSFKYQYFAGLSATLGAMAVGTWLGYSSTSGAQMNIEGNYTCSDPKLNDNQISWFSSTLTLGALFGGLTGGIFLKFVGRRGTMLLSVAPFLAGWLLIGLAQNFAMLIAGRIVGGYCCGLISLTVPTYIGEITSPEIRGTIGSAFQLMVTIGVLYSFLIGAFVCWKWLAVATVVIPILFGLAMFFSEESPTFFVSKNKELQAKKALQIFRGPRYNIESEIQIIREKQEHDRQNKLNLTDIKRPHIFKPLLISVALMFFQQFSGINAVLFNLTTIFSSAVSKTIKSEYQSIIIGTIQVVMTAVSTVLMDKAGRKLLLIVSASIMALSLAGLGAFFFVQQKDDYFEGSLGWLPLTSLIIFISAFSVGYGPIPWLMMGELFSSDVKEVAGSVATFTNWMFAFIVTIIFTPLQRVMYDYGVYWLFAAVCIINVVFCFMFVVETKGKTLEEINAIFQTSPLSGPGVDSSVSPSRHRSESRSSAHSGKERL